MHLLIEPAIFYIRAQFWRNLTIVANHLFPTFVKLWACSGAQRSCTPVKCKITAEHSLAGGVS